MTIHDHDKNNTAKMMYNSSHPKSRQIHNQLGITTTTSRPSSGRGNNNNISSGGGVQYKITSSTQSLLNETIELLNNNEKYRPAFSGAGYDTQGFCLKHVRSCSSVTLCLTNELSRRQRRSNSTQLGDPDSYGYSRCAIHYYYLSLTTSSFIILSFFTNSQWLECAHPPS